MKQFVITRATTEQAPRLTEIARAAKAYWGYPDAWLTTWEFDLTVTPAVIASSECYVAASDDEPIAFYVLEGKGRRTILDHLWVTPEWIGHGVGSALLAHAKGRAASLGSTCIEIVADPHAEGFYSRHGAVRVGESVGEVFGERRALPVLELAVDATRWRRARNAATRRGEHE